MKGCPRCLLLHSKRRGPCLSQFSGWTGLGWAVPLALCNCSQMAAGSGVFQRLHGDTAMPGPPSVSTSPRASPLHAASSRSLASKVAPKSTQVRPSFRPRTGIASILLQFSGLSHRPSPGVVGRDHSKMQRPRGMIYGGCLRN